MAHNEREVTTRARTTWTGVGSRKLGMIPRSTTSSHTTRSPATVSERREHAAHGTHRARGGAFLGGSWHDTGYATSLGLLSKLGVGGGTAHLCSVVITSPLGR